MFETGRSVGPTRGVVAGLALAYCSAGCAGKAIIDDRAGGGSSAQSAGAGSGNESGQSGGKAASIGNGGSGGLDGKGPGSAGAQTGAGSGGTGDTGAGGTATGSGAGGSVVDPHFGVPLTPVDGWIDGASNVLNIQGALFAASDPTTMMGFSSDLAGLNACMAGTAAKVDMASDVCVTKMFPPPATDCYGYFWGAELALNLNQPLDPVTMASATPIAFNASALKGFAFDITGSTVPGPGSLRFQIETSDRVFCNPPSTKIKVGSNVVLFSDLLTRCFAVSDSSVSAETAKSAFIRISWNVVTNASATVPFDFCVSNIRALPK